jgi:hypothetical protein
MRLPPFLLQFLLLLLQVPSVASQSCSICGIDKEASLPDALFSFPKQEAVSCRELELDGKRGEIAPRTCKLLPQVLGNICGCKLVNGTSCSVCGKGMKVGNLDGVFSFRGQSTISCRELEEAGISGKIQVSECSNITNYILDVCECTKSPIRDESKLAIAEDGCSVCGKGQEVGKLDATFTTPNGDRIPCGVLQEAGAKSQLTDAECQEFPMLVKEPCKCRDSGSTDSPAIAPVPLQPYQVPSHPPKSSLPSRRELDSLSPSIVPKSSLPSRRELDSLSPSIVPIYYEETEDPSQNNPNKQPSSDSLSFPMSSDPDSRPKLSGEYFFSNHSSTVEDADYKVKGQKSEKGNSQDECARNETSKGSKNNKIYWYDDDSTMEHGNIEDEGCSKEVIGIDESKVMDDDGFHDYSRKKVKGHTLSNYHGKKGNEALIKKGKGKGLSKKNDGVMM